MSLNTLLVDRNDWRLNTMVKECPVLVNNDQVTVVKFNNTDVQFPSIKKNCKSVFVNFENGKYSIVEKPVVNKEPENKPKEMFKYEHTKDKKTTEKQDKR